MAANFAKSCGYFAARRVDRRIGTFSLALGATCAFSLGIAV